MKLNVRQLSSGLAFGLLLSLISVTHIPSKFLHGVFDRNAAPQFITLLIVSIAALVGLAFKGSLTIGKSALVALASVVIFSTISLFLSDSFLTSFLGDTGRYTGYASLVALVALGLAASSLNWENFREFLLGLSVGIVLVTLIGLLQALNLIDLPTGAGVGSTLGNLDFLSAWIGTTILLLFVLQGEYEFHPAYFAAYVATALYVMWKIEAKQGFLDIALTVLGVGAIAALRRVSTANISKTGWKALATFLILIWSEAIYLIPMAKVSLPGIGDDPQVSIRSDFWFSAAQMFSHHFGFGVGPDNYGNYYEKYRSLHSVKATEFVLANDAHSSMLQTFATLGIFATLAFLVVILLVTYAAIDLYFATENRSYAYLLLAFFIFYTNSLISPITLPHKAIFWALAGYLLGEQARRNLIPTLTLPRISTHVLSIGIAGILISAGAIFVPAFVHFNDALVANNEGRRVSYVESNALPCVAYAGAQIQLVAKSGGDIEDAATSILRNHPRCLDALIYMAQISMSQKNYAKARPYIYQLLDVAPARNSVVRLAAIYAMAAHDEPLKELLTSQGLKLGILTESSLK